MRDIIKNVSLEIEGEEMRFAIRKMNAFDGSYLLKVVTEKLIPLFKNAMDSINSGEEQEVSLAEMFSLLPNLLQSLSAEEMKKIMSMCLKTVQCILPAGYQPVLDAHDNFGIEELEYDVASCLRLTYEVIIYNCSGFFGDSGLGSVLANLNGSQPMP